MVWKGRCNREKSVDEHAEKHTSTCFGFAHINTLKLAETMRPDARKIQSDKHLTRDSSKRPNKLNVCVDGQEGIRSVVLIVSECAGAVPLSSKSPGGNVCACAREEVEN